MRRVVPALLAGVILGILGMHVLGQHCAAPVEGPVGAMGTTTAAAAHAAMGHVEHASEPVLSAAAAVAVVAGDASGTAHVGLMLCAFIVLGSAVALLLAALRGHPRLPSYDVRRARSLVPRLRASPSGTGPPAVWQFSVIRC